MRFEFYLNKNQTLLNYNCILLQLVELDNKIEKDQQMVSLENSLNEKPASNSQIDVEPNNNYSTSSKLLTSLININ